jgi:hypothetical protein
MTAIGDFVARFRAGFTLFFLSWLEEGVLTTNLANKPDGLRPSLRLPRIATARTDEGSHR